LAEPITKLGIKKIVYVIGALARQRFKFLSD